LKKDVDTKTAIGYGIAMIKSGTSQNKETKMSKQPGSALRTDAGYCSKSDDDNGRHDCANCSLCNYGRDCRNNPITETDAPYYLLAGIDRARAAKRQGITE
jgi:hypothetical protein